MKHRHVMMAAATTVFASTQSAFAFDDCLLGTWNADLDAMAEQTARVGQFIQSVSVTGSVQMSVTEDMRFVTKTENLNLDMAMDGMNAQSIMNGLNEGSIDGDGGEITIAVETFDVVTEMKVGNDVRVIPGKPPGTPPETFVGTYTCSDTTLDLVLEFAEPQPDGVMPSLPHRFTR